MLRSTRFNRLVVGVGTGILMAAGLVAGAPAHASAPSSSVTILLKAPDQAGLNRLAAAQGLSHAQRVTALASLLPSTAAHQQVSAELAARGFTVTAQTAWTITAAAPSTTVASTFGAPSLAPAGSRELEQTKAAANPPAIPPGISTLAAAVLPTSGGPQLFSPLDQCSVRCHNGADFRDAYTAPKVAPSIGKDANGPVTIATLQFAGWNPSDLTGYAKSVGLPDPITLPAGDPQFTQIPVGEAKVPAATKGEHEADEEVDLDQETILSTDPNANQRAYFSPISSNNMSGYARDLGQVVSDVTQGPNEIDGGDPNIVALSTSWGTCESEFTFGFPADTIRAVENVLKSLTAAGVTVFAASGDNGVYDCGDAPDSSKVAVDYPASSPEVVGVGGTRLRSVGAPTVNNGKNWTDSAWSCTSPQICQGSADRDTGGTGGGESNRFAMPAYQSAGLGHTTFTTTTGKKASFGSQARRLVPDIADDGDPATGFEMLTSDPRDVPSCAPPHATTCTPESFAIGGTSLSSPEAASLFTDMLAAHGVTHGVGDIHNALYSAYAANQGDFRDITTGTNGRQQDVDLHATSHAGAEFPVNAQKGYDTLTGLGAPLWPRLAPFIFAPLAPRLTATMALASPHTPSLATTVTVGWHGVQAAKGGSLPRSASVTISRLGVKAPVFHTVASPATGSHSFVAAHGGNYLLLVTERDLDGQSSTTLGHLVVPFDDRSFTLHGIWTTVNGVSDYAGSHVTADARGAYARATGTGRRYALAVRTGPAYGHLAIYQGTTRLGTFDLYSPTIAHTRIAFFGTATTPIEMRSFTFRYTGGRDAKSMSATVDLDALYVYR
jgi:hypothetical protein